VIVHTEDPDEIKRLIASHPAAIVDFSTQWCGPCKKLELELQTVDGRYGANLAIIKVDKDAVRDRSASSDAVAEKGFSDDLPFYKDVSDLGGVPVIVFFKDGKLIDKVLDAGEPKKGMIFGLIPGLKAPGNQSISIEEIMLREKMVARRGG
jgi:thiol-disulfide isomerase/thioredoxin